MYEINNIIIIITTLCQKRLTDDVVKGKLAAYVRPANLPSLSVVKVNHEVWSKLSSVTRSRDIKIQRVTNVITQSMVAVTSVADDLVTATRSDETLSKAKMAAALVMFRLMIVRMRPESGNST